MAEIIVLVILFFALAVADASVGDWLLFVVVGIFALRSWAARRKLAKLSKKAEPLLDSDLPGRLYKLEGEQAQLTRRIYELELARFEPRHAASAKIEAEALPSAKTPVPVEPPPTPSGAPKAAPQAPQPWPRPTAPSGPVPEAAAPDSQPPSFSIPDQSPAGPTLSERLRSLLDIEEMLGTNWLSKVGVAILVLGFAFFLAWQLRELGPAGKVVVGLLVSSALIGAGIYLERSDRYRILGRASLAGGWPLLFFVSYAMYHVPAARVLPSPLADLLVMMLVVGGMVTHTLRYRSQVVSGLVFALAFSTIALNRTDVYSLSANVVLALALSVVALRMQWFELEIFGILAAYLNHFYWLWPIINPMGGKVHHFPQYYWSAGILLLYWAIFRASYVARPGVNERLSAVAGILNTLLLLSVLKYQSAHPELAFWALLVLGAIEFSLGQLPIVRRKRTTFIVLTTLGSALVMAAFPFRYAPDQVSPIWMIEAEVLFVAGVLAREEVFRRLGNLAAAATAIQLVAVQGARVLGARMDGGYVVHHWTLGAVFAFAMVAIYANTTWPPRRRPELFAAYVDQRLTKCLIHTAAVLGVVGAWAAFPESGTAVVWMMLALAMGWAASRFKLPEVTLQATVVTAIAVLRTLAVNLDASQPYALGLWHPSVRLLTVSAVALMAYLLTRWSRTPELPLTRYSSPALSWAGSMLVSLLIWYELRPVSVAAAWTFFGLILLEIGCRRGSLSLRAQAYVALASSFFRVFFVNLNAESTGALLSPRLYTVVPVGLAMYYVYERARAGADQLSERERAWGTASAFAWLGTVTFVALLRFELALDWVAAGWAGVCFVLVYLAARTGRRVLLHQAIAISFAVLFRGALHNLYERSYFPPPGRADRWIMVGSAVALLLATLPFAFRLRRTEPEQAAGRWHRFLRYFDARPEQVLFFIPVLLTTLLLAAEMRRGFLTVSWGLEAVIIFLAALWIRERSYRLTGLALLLLCISKIFVFDFWTLGIRDKALTGIGLGVAVILVSTLYTRKRDAIRQLL